MRHTSLYTFLIITILTQQSIYVSALLSSNTCSLQSLIFRSTDLTCQPCAQNEILVNGLCTCQAGYYYGVDPTTLVKTCTACPNGQMASSDLSFCVNCSTQYNAASSVPCLCPGVQVALDRDIATNVPLNNTQCTSCPIGTYPNVARNQCLPCSDNRMIATIASGANSTATFSCQCPSDMIQGKQGICLLATYVTAASTLYPDSSYASITYYNLSDGTLTLESALMQNTFLEAYISCRYVEQSEACQRLANLCVLMDYDTTSAPCEAYQLLAKDRRSSQILYPDWPDGLPWLYYGLLTGESADTSLSKTVDIVTTSPLSFQLVMIALNGTFLGSTSLTHQLQLCESTSVLLPSATTFLHIGQSFKQQCAIDISTASLSQDPIFYELYLTSASGVSFPVPVRLLNYRVNGRYVNNPDDLSSDQLVRRFMLFDSVTSRKNGIAQVVRTASDMTLTLSFEQLSIGRLYSPILDISFSERRFSQIAVTSTFQVTYLMNESMFWQSVTIALIIIIMLAGVFWIQRVYQWTRRTRKHNSALDLAFIGITLMKLCGIMAPTLVAIQLGLGIYFYLFAKATSDVFVPIDNSWRTLLILSFLMQGVYISYRIYQQCNVDLFFIDWERKKSRESGSQSDLTTSGPSAWRMILAVNQWHQLQTIRTTNIAMTLFFMVLLMQGLQWKSNAVLVAVHPTLLLTLNAAVGLLLFSIQWIFKWLIMDRFYQNKILSFIDLLSCSNLSLLILDESFHGYYLHGKSVHASADVALPLLVEQWQRESMDLVERRGLVPGTQDQVMQVFLSQSLKDMIDRLYRMCHLSSENVSYPTNTNSANIIKAQQTMTRFFCYFFDKHLKDHVYAVQQRTLFDRWLQNVPDTIHMSVFYKDNNCSFKSTLLCGMEGSLLLFYLLLYTLIDANTDKAGVAALIIWIVDRIIVFLRVHFGGKNLARKSLVDNRFVL